MTNAKFEVMVVCEVFDKILSIFEKFLGSFTKEIFEILKYAFLHGRIESRHQ